MTYAPVSSSSLTVAVGAAAAQFAGTMSADTEYLFFSSTACWIKQGTTQLITCTTNANMLDGDKLVISVAGRSAPNNSVTYEYDKSANGVTAGNQSWAAGAATAIDVAATLATAIAAAQPFLAVTNNGNGTLTITALDAQATFTEQVSNAAFTVTSTTPLATAASGSMYVPANVQLVLSGDMGAQLGVLQDSVAGKASLTRTKVV